MSKKITVRYFALFREHAGLDAETISIDAETTADVFHLLKHRHGAAEPLARCKVAINDEMADWNSPVADGDVILLFPPVAGG